MENRTWGENTKAIHFGESDKHIEGAIAFPVFQSSTYEFTGEMSYDDVRYIRLNNSPNHVLLSKKIAALEGSEDSVVAASGMAAITATLLTVIGKGEHLLAQDSLYGGTHHFLKESFAEFGREVTFFPVDSENIESYLKPNTKAVYVESISNPLLRIPRLSEVIRVCKSKNLLSIIDNTFCSPVQYRPIEKGFDLSLHSATKFLNGHSDIVAGVVSGPIGEIRKIRKTMNLLGGCLDPHACFLLNRGMKTLGVRVKQQTENAGQVARLLQTLPLIEKVIYPGLENHPDYQKAREYFAGPGSMVSFLFKGSVSDLDRRLSSLKLFALAPSLGGVESLVTRPATTSHSGIPAAERQKLGVLDTLVRLSIGLEDASDLLADLTEGFGR